MTPKNLPRHSPRASSSGPRWLTRVATIATIATVGLASACSASPESSSVGSSESAVIAGGSPDPKATFRYDSALGRCVDADGNPGLNAPQIDAYFASSVPYRDAEVFFVRSSFPNGNAECMDFTGFDFTPRIGTEYAAMTGWNFRGAKLSGATLALAAIIDSDLAGADISSFVAGYIYVRASIDSFTKLPAGTGPQPCRATGNIVRCGN